MGNPRTKQHLDIIGSVVSIAAKIQAQAPVGGIVVGETVDRGIHIYWRERLREFQPNELWTYTRKDGQPYRLFEVAAPGQRSVATGMSPAHRMGVPTPSRTSGEPLGGQPADDGRSRGPARRGLQRPCLVGPDQSSGQNLRRPDKS